LLRLREYGRVMLSSPAGTDRRAPAEPPRPGDEVAGQDPSAPELEWLALARACATNGDDLLSDASVLLEHGRAPRALSLAVLAMEEYGKAMAAMAIIGSGGAEDDVRDYDTQARLHRPRLITSHAWADLRNLAVPLDDDYVERLREAVAVAGARKMAGLYVDRTPTGPRVPGEITVDEAVEMVCLARSIAAPLQVLLGPLASDALVALLWRLGPSLIAAAIRELETAGSLGEALERLRALEAAFPLEALPPMDAHAEGESP